jgi:DNA-binding MarR family transcriptional regulator
VSSPDHLPDDLGTALTRLQQIVRQATLPQGMSLAQARTMVHLRDAGPQRVTVLADLEHVAQPTMTALIGRMERRGWVTRRAEAGDRRAVLVELTDLGRKTLADLVATRSGALRAWLDQLPQGDRTALTRALPALHRLIAIAEARKETP